MTLNHRKSPVPAGRIEVVMERTKILVVDDESRMRKLVKDFLQKNNYEVLEAGDGSEALDIFFEQNDIALIILDVMMPKMDGWQVCRDCLLYTSKGIAVPGLAFPCESPHQIIFRFAVSKILGHFFHSFINELCLRYI